LPISATKEFLKQYDEIRLFHYPNNDKESDDEMYKLYDIYETFRYDPADYGGIDKDLLITNKELMGFLSKHMPEIYNDINNAVYGKRTYGGRKQKRSSKKSRSSKRKPSLVEVDINTVLNCKNKKHGCDLRAKQFTCYKRMRCKTNKSSPDKITLTNSRNKSKKIRPVIRVENVWYDCSHFTK
jgi:hypothetical protein